MILKLLFCLLIFSNLSFTEVTDTFREEDSTAPAFVDFSSSPLRSDWNQCSQEDLRAREQLQTTCRQDFQRRGLGAALTPDEIVEARSCSSIESFGEVLGGCAKGFLLDVLGGIPSLAFSFSPRQIFATEIQSECGDEPQNANYDSLLAGSAPIPSEQAGIDRFLVEQRAYRACRRTTIRTERARRSSERVNVRRRVQGYQQRCRNGILGRRPSATAVNNCALTLAGQDDCEACIANLNSSLLDIPRALIRSMWDEIRQLPSMECFNPETQGRMICNSLAALAGGGALAQGARRLPSALQNRLAARAADDVTAPPPVTPTTQAAGHIEEASIVGLQRLHPNKGAIENFFFTGQVNGQRAFIKTLDDVDDVTSERLMDNEIAMFRELAEHDITPRFLGTTEIGGRRGFALEYIEGYITKGRGTLDGLDGNPPPAGFQVHDTALADIERTRQVLLREGYNPSDLQFLISSDGRRAYLVDVEQYSRGPFSPQDEIDFANIVRDLSAYR